jgi:hypothetical protein
LAIATKLSEKQVKTWFQNERRRRHSADNARKRKTLDVEAKPHVKAQSDDGEDIPAFIPHRCHCLCRVLSSELFLPCLIFALTLLVCVCVISYRVFCFCFFSLHHGRRYGNVYIL